MILKNKSLKVTGYFGREVIDVVRFFGRIIPVKQVVGSQKCVFFVLGTVV